MKTKHQIYALLLFFTCAVSQANLKNVVSSNTETINLKNTQTRNNLDDYERLFGHFDRLTTFNQDEIRFKYTTQKENADSSMKSMRPAVGNEISPTLFSDKGFTSLHYIIVVLIFIMVAGNGILIYFFICKNINWRLFVFQGEGEANQNPVSSPARYHKKSSISSVSWNPNSIKPNRSFRNSITFGEFERNENRHEILYEQSALKRSRIDHRIRGHTIHVNDLKYSYSFDSSEKDNQNIDLIACEEPFYSFDDLFKGNLRVCSEILFRDYKLKSYFENTLMYEYLRAIIGENDQFQKTYFQSKNVDECKNQLNEEQIQFILKKLNYFLNNVNKIYKSIINKEIKDILEDLKKKLKIINNMINQNQDINSIQKSLFYLIYTIWTNYDIPIFEICNAAMIIDLYYLGKKSDRLPKGLCIENCDFTRKGFKEKIEILGSYCVCLCLAAKIISNSCKPSVVYRGLSYKSEKTYEVGKIYSFASFQTSSTDKHIAELCLANEQSTFLEISIPEQCDNCVQTCYLNETMSMNDTECIILPYTSFRLDKIKTIEITRMDKKFEIPKYYLTIMSEGLNNNFTGKEKISETEKYRRRNTMI